MLLALEAIDFTVDDEAMPLRARQITTPHIEQ
jgi:hypothetical protein